MNTIPPSPPAAAATSPYPTTAREAVVEQLFGEAIADPYRWLENDVRQDPRVASWVAEQNAVTDAYLATLPMRDAFRTRMTQLWNYARYGLPVKRGTHYFYRKNDGLQNQSLLYLREGADAEPMLLIDPNDWADDGATALAEWEPSNDGHLLAYSVQDGGSDWRTVHVLTVATAQPLADEVRWVKFSNLSWAADGSGFYYCRFPEPAEGAEFQSLNLNHAVYFHRLGEPQAQDRLVYATPERPQLSHFAEVTDDGRWLLIQSSSGTDARYEVTLLDLADAGARPRQIVTGLDYNWQLAGNVGSRFYFVTNHDAPRQRIVTLDVASPDAQPQPLVEPLVAEQAATLDSAGLIGNVLVAQYLVDARSEARLYALDGQPLGSVPLPGIGTASGFGGRAGDPETYFSFESFNRPASIYRYDTATRQMQLYVAPQLSFNADDYEVSQHFYSSRDGTRVPMFVAHRRGLDLAAGAPTMLYGYGGFNISLTPSFSPAILAWMEAGGVYALANIRGGGEYGKAWHDGGRLANKQNTFDDFIAAGEYLIAQRIARPDGLAIRGGSNGGLLVGAVVNQRPDLFAAALPAVGVMDMLRFDRFTAGRYWVDDYGSPAVEADFRVLRAYSPYHNIRKGTPYPAILVGTADTDDRVVPGHSFKYTAALQAARLGPRPQLIRIETRAGHGSGKPTDKLIEEYADLWAFAAQWTGMEPPPAP